MEFQTFTVLPHKKQQKYVYLIIFFALYFTDRLMILTLLVKTSKTCILWWIQKSVAEMTWNFKFKILNLKFSFNRLYGEPVHQVQIVLCLFWRLPTFKEFNIFDFNQDKISVACIYTYKYSYYCLFLFLFRMK